MIRYEWHESLSADAVGEVAELLREAASYDEEAGFSSADCEAEPRPGLRQLLVRIGPSLVAYLHMDVVGAVGDVQFVVRPDYRSRGVATLLLERLRREPAGLPAIEGVRTLRVWAHGSHPAAHRMAARFGGRSDRAVYRMVRGREEPQYVDAEDEARLYELLRAGFEHEHTDVRFILDLEVPEMLAEFDAVYRAHVANVVAGDLKAVLADMLPTTLPPHTDGVELPPRRLTGADVVDVRLEGDRGIGETLYRAEDRVVALRSIWVRDGGAWKAQTLENFEPPADRAV